MQKRGQLVLKPIIDLILAVVIVAFLLYIARGYGTQEFPMKERIARDGASLVNVMSGLKGNMWLKYPADMKDYVIELKQNSFSIEAQPKPFSQLFVGNIVPTRIEKKKDLYFTEDRGKTSITDTIPVLHKLSCPIIKYKAVNPKLEVTQQTADIAPLFFFENKVGKVCSPELLCAKAESLLKQEGDIFIKIIPLEQEGVVARYPQSSEESKQLACAFLNSLKDVDNVWLLPTKELPQERVLLIEVGAHTHEQTAQALREILT